MFPEPIQKAPFIARGSYRIILYVTLIVWMLPLAGVFLTSFRSLADINSGNYWGWPTEFALVENYTQVFTVTPMIQYFLNSLVITIPTVLGTLLLSSLAGYSLAKHRFRGNFLIFALFIAGNFVPAQILMIPVRNLTLNLGVYDTKLALILFHTSFQIGFCTFFLRGFIKELPHELVESARIEGASEFRVYWNIIMPLVLPALAALAVLEFTFIWNDYFWALVLVQGDEARPVTLGIQALRGRWTASWHLISAGSIVAALPPVVLFFMLQKHFITGLTLGAIKE
ncbi:MAG: carbohydrate ABC transporter permease [SAR324 cluster bacterium]|jgi:multiple sugar transport system permease protein|nr:carbohydrate ABC transporter permease [SAR324 cluster bacterium]MDP7335797.1 carbohydrate ABC transporter permease [SAR324 cluster bacterium]GIT08745.1 MAG: ABC transporter permease [Pseudomonadota bacterium]|tara:strand:+ start:530 stop:1381 length:852 start_codon:yes stop_codon:yes gene_type:complete